jgi:hypothetical protein
MSNKKLSSSPGRGSFRSQRLKEQLESDDEQERESAQSLQNFYSSWLSEKRDIEQESDWSKNNLEYDLRSTDWILTKVRENNKYAQNLYAALCNNEFVRADAWPILKEEHWGCSWRYAGGIVADMQQEGDYIDWYCSGIGDGLGNGDSDRTRGYVSEGVVTEEIAQDLKTLGWLVVDNKQD